MALREGMRNRQVTNLQKPAPPRGSNPEHATILMNKGFGSPKQIEDDIRQIAPEPGALVLIHTEMIPLPHSTFDSVLLSAMDSCTHLQIARFYFASSLAATIDFLEFIVKMFPFPIAELRADHSQVFPSDTDREVEHRFMLAAQRVGMRHSIRDLQGDGVESNLQQYFFEIGVRPHGTQEDDEALLADLQQFLLFHNNHRALPTLEGKTPVGKLRSFEPYRDLKAFDVGQELPGR